MTLEEMFEEEQERQETFRQDVLERLTEIELYVAGKKGAEAALEKAEDKSRDRKVYLVSTLIALAGVILPIVFK